MTGGEKEVKISASVHRSSVCARTYASFKGAASKGGQKKISLGRITNISSSRTDRRRGGGRGRGATLHSSTPRDVFFVIRGMAYATDRTVPLSLVLTLDALVRRACRNGAPVLLRLAEAKFILVSRSGTLPLSLSPPSPLLLLLFFPLTLECVRESSSLHLLLRKIRTTHTWSFFREIRLDELSASRYYCARGAAR